MFKRKLFFLSFYFFVGSAMAAGLDCNGSSVLAERLICSDSELNELDVDLNAAYRLAMDAASPSSKSALVAEQRNWLAYTRNSCGDASCLKVTYRARIAILRENLKWIVNDPARYATVDNERRIVVFQRDPNGETSFFNKRLAQNGYGRLIECHRLLGLPVGYANSDEAYGGYCTITIGKDRRAVMVCADKFVGHLSVENLQGESQSDQDLIEFTSRNCFGG